MDQELSNLIVSVKNDEIKDEELKKLALIAEARGGKCPRCGGKHEIVVGLLKNLKILTCKYCESERREHGISANELRKEQLNSKVTLGTIPQGFVSI
ncbi:hypothetical protein FJZ41_03655 [Candidatus Shapirobacteria bacterium]|nr:hypothetical protein [Candidatus Shapirobacteria bacterium]